MFTGIIEHLGEVIVNEVFDGANHLLVKTSFSELSCGESIAVDGVCLTLLPTEAGILAFDISPETLQCTSLGELKPRDKVNLERALAANARFGGHYVSGHVDTTAFITSKKPMGEFIELKVGGFLASASLYLLPKGSVTLDGVSLTINTVSNNEVSLMLVPHTLEQTTLGQAVVGQRLNVEFDYLTRIVAHQLRVAGQLNHEVNINE